MTKNTPSHESIEIHFPWGLSAQATLTDPSGNRILMPSFTDKLWSLAQPQAQLIDATGKLRCTIAQETVTTTLLHTANLERHYTIDVPKGTLMGLCPPPLPRQQHTKEKQEKGT